MNAYKPTESNVFRDFTFPQLLNYRGDLLTLELSYVRPPFALDFAGATIDSPPPRFDFESAEWIQEKCAIYGTKWPEVNRLLDALRHLGIYYPDVHIGNIRLEEYALTSAVGSDPRGLPAARVNCSAPMGITTPALHSFTGSRASRKCGDKAELGHEDRGRLREVRHIWQRRDLRPNLRFRQPGAEPGSRIRR